MPHLNYQETIKLLGLPTTAFVIAFGIFYGAQVDFSVAAAIFHLEGDHWSLTDHWLLSDVLHSGSRFVNNIVIASLFCFWLYKIFGFEGNQERKIAMTKLVLSLVLSFSLVALIKRWIPAECPWDLLQFGGDQPFIGLLEVRPLEMHPTQCFPAGHASIGYVWVALYFYFLPVSIMKARTGLLVGLTLGLILGAVQQLRGAHFVSHDLTTLWLCWSVSCLVYWLYPNRK